MRRGEREEVRLYILVRASKRGGETPRILNVLASPLMTGRLLAR